MKVANKEHPLPQLLQDLKDGKIAIEFNAEEDNLEDLRRVLEYVFPEDTMTCAGTLKYYRSCDNTKEWRGTFCMDIPSKKLNEFIKAMENNLKANTGKFQVGDTVKVVRKCKNREGDWDSCWVDSMEDYIGNNCEVVCEAGLCGYELRFNNRRYAFFPEFVLEKVEDFILPEKWHIEVTNENREEINNWKIKQKFNDSLFDYLGYKYVLYDGSGNSTRIDNCELITFEQFKKYILMKENKEIIGYESPQDYFEGRIPKGTLYIIPPSGVEGMYKPKLVGMDLAYSLPKEIVETWKPIYKKKSIFPFTLSQENAIKILNIACDSWVKKLLDKWGESIFSGDYSVVVTEDFYKEMFIHCNTSQEQLFEKIFGKHSDIV